MRKGIVAIMVFMVAILTACQAETPKVDTLSISYDLLPKVNATEPNRDLSLEQILNQEYEELAFLEINNDGFRQSMDELFNINRFTEDDYYGKSGCLFVNSENARDDNNCLNNVFRNKAFITKYWAESEIGQKMADEAEKVYTDLEGKESNKTAGALNAYFNLFPAGTKLEPDRSLTRREFYTAEFRASNGVVELEPSDGYLYVLGLERKNLGNEELSNLAIMEKQSPYMWLSIEDNSFSLNYLDGLITNFEVRYFLDRKYSAGTEQALDLTGASKGIGGLQIMKDKARVKGLADMMSAAGKNEGQLRDKEAVTRVGALIMIVNKQLALNENEGYLSTSEY